MLLIKDKNMKLKLNIKMIHINIIKIVYGILKNNYRNIFMGPSI